MTRYLAGVLVFIAACVDSPTSAKLEATSSTPPLNALLVTDPTGGSLAAQVGGPAVTSPPDVVWVSLPPGAVPSAETAIVRVRGGASAVTVTLIDGGFDPIAIPAAVDDTLEALVALANGDTMLMSIVPRSRRPAVVRTIPPRGKKAVPLNALLTVVFSEPLDPIFLNAETVRLQGPSGAVSGRRTPSSDGLRVEFEPASLLIANATYSLVVDGVRDREGDLMEAKTVVAFSTSEATPTAPAGNLAASMVFAADLRACPEGCVPDAGIVSSIDIYVAKASGPPTRLTTHPAHDLHPSWSPDGKRILFQSERDGNAEVYVMSADGSAQVRLTNHPARDEEPTWSPDGSRIAFVSSRDGNQELYVMNASGSAVTRLTDHSASDRGPSWAPDGTRIAYSSERDGASEIYVLRLSDLSIARVTDNVVADVTPAWSPDGSRIAFSRFVPNGVSATECVTIEDEYASMCRWDVVVVNPDGSSPIRMDLPTVPGSLDGWWRSVIVATEPAWSPDGSRIAAKAFICLSDLGGADCHASTRIIEMYSNGAGGVRYQSSGIAPLDFRFWPVLSHPSWHP